MCLNTGCNQQLSLQESKQKEQGLRYDTSLQSYLFSNKRTSFCSCRQWGFLSVKTFLICNAPAYTKMQNREHSTCGIAGAPSAALWSGRWNRTPFRPSFFQQICNGPFHATAACLFPLSNTHCNPALRRAYAPPKMRR